MHFLLRGPIKLVALPFNWAASYFNLRDSLMAADISDTDLSQEAFKVRQITSRARTTVEDERAATASDPKALHFALSSLTTEQLNNSIPEVPAESHLQAMLSNLAAADRLFLEAVQFKLSTRGLARSSAIGASAISASVLGAIVYVFTVLKFADDHAIEIDGFNLSIPYFLFGTVGSNAIGPTPFFLFFFNYLLRVLLKTPDLRRLAHDSDRTPLYKHLVKFVLAAMSTLPVTMMSLFTEGQLVITANVSLIQKILGPFAFVTSTITMTPMHFLALDQVATIKRALTRPVRHFSRKSLGQPERLRQTHLAIGRMRHNDLLATLDRAWARIDAFPIGVRQHVTQGLHELLDANQGNLNDQGDIENPELFEQLLEMIVALGQHEKPMDHLISSPLGWGHWLYANLSWLTIVAPLCAILMVMITFSISGFGSMAFEEVPSLAEHAAFDWLSIPKTDFFAVPLIIAAGFIAFICFSIFFTLVNIVAKKSGAKLGAAIKHLLSIRKDSNHKNLANIQHWFQQFFDVSNRHHMILTLLIYGFGFTMASGSWAASLALAEQYFFSKDWVMAIPGLRGFTIVSIGVGAGTFNSFWVAEITPYLARMINRIGIIGPDAQRDTHLSLMFKELRERVEFGVSRVRLLEIMQVLKNPGRFLGLPDSIDVSHKTIELASIAKVYYDNGVFDTKGMASVAHAKKAAKADTHETYKTYATILVNELLHYLHNNAESPLTEDTPHYKKVSEDPKLQNDPQYIPNDPVYFPFRIGKYSLKHVCIQRVYAQAAKSYAEESKKPGEISGLARGVAGTACCCGLWRKARPADSKAGDLVELQMRQGLTSQSSPQKSVRLYGG